jgi:hypothetical protein
MLWSAGAFAEIKEGLWEITTQVEIKEMPQAMPPTTTRQCITQSDPVPKNEDKNHDCKIIDQKVSGSKISYTVECKLKEGVMHTSGTTTYTGSSMDGTSNTSFKMEGQPPIQMSSRIKGKYIGPCPE